MSLVPKKTDNTPETPNAAPGTGEVAAEPPTYIAFGMDKVGPVYKAVAYKIRGGKVVQTKVLEEDDFRVVVVDAVGRAAHDLWTRLVDPFSEKPAEPPMKFS